MSNGQSKDNRFYHHDRSSVIIINAELTIRLSLFRLNLQDWNMHKRDSYKKIVSDSLDSNNITKHGHMFSKTYEEGDDKLLLEPHRHICDGIFLYKRYTHYQHTDETLLTECHCNHVGGLCRYCVVLNTSDFHGLTIPLNPEDWDKMKDFFLMDQKWSEKNLYNWLVFWCKQIENRWSREHPLFASTSHTPVFFRYDKFFRKNKHWFFYYVYKFIIDKHVLKKDPPCQAPCKVDKYGDVIKHPYQKALPDCQAIITCDAMIRLSFRIYAGGGRITDTTTHWTSFSSGRSILTYTSKLDPRNDAFEIRQKAYAFHQKRMWKRVFEYTRDEIDNEVRWRPGMCGAEECHSSFQIKANGLMSPTTTL